jgi:Fe2+ transport system protein FeoA
MGIFPGAELTLIPSDTEDGSVNLKVGEAHLTVGRQAARSVLVETPATS